MQMKLKINLKRAGERLTYKYADLADQIRQTVNS